MYYRSNLLKKNLINKTYLALLDYPFWTTSNELFTLAVKRLPVMREAGIVSNHCLWPNKLIYGLK